MDVMSLFSFWEAAVCNSTSANSVTVTIIHVSDYIVIHVKDTKVKLTVHAVTTIPDHECNNKI